MTKRIKLSAGDYVLLSDIPNKQVFNLVKDCFINAGFNDCNGEYVQWNQQGGWPLIKLTFSQVMYAYMCPSSCKRQLSLSDIFNSVNGGFCWGTSDVYIVQTNWTDATRTSRNCVEIKRIPEATEAIIQPNTPQWWNYEKGCAVGLPEKNTVVLYNGKEYEVIRFSTDTNCVFLCPNEDYPYSTDMAWVNVFNIKPLDYKTPKQIAVNKAFACLSEFRSAEQVLGELYDKGMLQVI